MPDGPPDCERATKRVGAEVSPVSYEHLLFEIRDGVARATLNRPDRLNSFNDAMHAELRDALDRVRGDAGARAL